MTGRTDINRYKNQKGLTLIEVMVGLVIVGISILVMYIMFINGRQMITEQYHRKLALEKARSVIEDMQYSYKEFGRVPASFRGTKIDSLISDSDEHVGISAERTVEVEYSRESDQTTGLPYYSLVRVIYEWQELSGREYQIELRAAF